MSFEIQTTSYFDSEAKRLAKRHHSFVDDLQDFRDSILKNPYQGTELSPGIRKVRLTIGSKGRGKSGGARIITFTYLVDEKDGVVMSRCHFVIMSFYEHIVCYDKLTRLMGE